jgi:hypothetical protein
MAFRVLEALEVLCNGRRVTLWGAKLRAVLDPAGYCPRVEQAATALRAALALWRGPSLGELAFEPFAHDEVAALEELRLRRSSCDSKGTRRRVARSR